MWQICALAKLNYRFWPWRGKNQNYPSIKNYSTRKQKKFPNGFEILLDWSSLLEI